jgi:hypothetical protein
VTEKRLKAAANQAVSYRNYRRARDRALARLANAHPNQYKEYLEEEKANDERVGKKWLDITGVTAISNLDTRASTTPAGPQATDNSEDEGDRGGEA